ncbi:hypothetical protein P4H39_28820 [Paenibacillus lautus]|uniref:hypothetical protein n=1 Tax=Paenibacillus lautus TaxID=1401 RepID=UPI002DBEDF1D|nr:hypothetical protein [Paenibacillus lautus]MEC0206613.1 hypothetical protein [Paenibacillus lautus]
MQKELDEIYEKIESGYEKVTSNEITKLVEMINQRFTHNDIILNSLSKEELLRNIDYLTRATYELTKKGISRSKHYILSNLYKGSYGLDSKSRKKIFVKQNMMVEDEFDFRNNYISFKFLIHDRNPLLLMKHNYGFGSITNWVEKIVDHIDQHYLQDLGFSVILDNVSIYYRDAVLGNVPKVYDRVEFADKIQEPVWTGVEAEWFEAIWNQYSIDDNVIKEPLFFLGDLAYSANKKIREIIISAKKKIIIIDPYIDSTIFELLENANKEVNIQIHTSNLQGDSESVYKLFKKERGKIEVSKYKKLHDRYIIVDERNYYLLGASINSFGDKATTLVPIHEPKIKDEILSFCNNIKHEGSSL